MSYRFKDGDPIKAIDVNVNRECGFLPENSRGHVLLIRDNLVSFRIDTGSMGNKTIEAVCSTEVFSMYFTHRNSGTPSKDLKTIHYTRVYPNSFRK